MIAFARGVVADIGPTTAVLDLGGFGVELQCAPGTLAGLRRGEVHQLATSLVVREDSLTLFGFAETQEKQFFELLQTASGVGPKLAQAILAVLSPDQISQAVSTEDVKQLTRVPGVGQKGAQRLILELKDKVSATWTTSAEIPSTSTAWEDPVRQGLIGLGWSAKDAERAIRELSASTPSSNDVAALLRQALQLLSRTA